MNHIDHLEVLARGASGGAFLSLAILCARAPASPARLTGLLLCLAAAAHTLTQMEGLPSALGWGRMPVWAISVMGAGFFWAFALEVFGDGGRLSRRRFLPALALLAIGLAAAGTRGELQRTFYLAHNLLGGGLILHGLLQIAQGWRGDLVEARRRLRGPILAVASAYALGVIAVQIAELYAGPADVLSPLAALALLTLALMSIAAFGRTDADLFGAPAPAVATEVDAAPVPLDGEDARVAAALDQLMREERVYREEGLTIAALALRLRVPEHRLRQLINQRLGHRNFNAYLNRWRLSEAKAALSDPAQKEVPVSTIALDAGFASLGPFNRSFKAETGLTPTEFRARALAINPGIF